MQTIPMPRNVQLHIPEPCHQDWHRMMPEEKGRFCSSCSKTVVDFSLMSDKEILAYLAEAGSHTCGRFSPDQLKRNLMPSPQRKWSWRGVWQLALATVLVSSRADAQMGKPKISIQQTDKRKDAQRMPVHPIIKKPKVIVEKERMTMGLVYIPPPKRDIGKVMGNPPDSATRLPLRASDAAIMHGPAIDSPIGNNEFRPPSGMDKNLAGTQPLVGIAGGISLGAPVRTVTTWMIDTVRNFLADSLAIPALRCQALNVYPNPVSRGSVIRIDMRPQPAGEYKLALYNAAGARIQERIVNLEGKDQVELWNMPSSLAAGIYLIELCTPQLKRIYSGKLVVE
jgi:hypothetical protein